MYSKQLSYTFKAFVVFRFFAKRLLHFQTEELHLNQNKVALKAFV